MYVRVDRRASSKSERRSPGRHVAFFLVPGLVSGAAALPQGLGAAQAVTPSQLSIAQTIVDMANQYGVPPSLALGIASHESGFNPTLTNVNNNGTVDYGVMQLNTSVLQTYGLSTSAAMDPQQNINTGVQLLASLLQKYNGDPTLALWAYANGSGSVATAGANPANMSSATSSFVNYVTGYQPPASLALPATSDLSLDSAPAPADSPTWEFPTLDLSSVSSFFDTIDPTTLGIAAAAIALLAVGISE